MTSTESFISSSKNTLLNWEFFVLKIFLLILAMVFISKPVGGITGRIAMEQEGFNLYSYDMKSNKVYALAIGPRGKNTEERGVWVDKEGKFTIAQLPVGEYSLKIRVPGFSTTYESGIFVADGKITSLKSPIKLAIAQPSTSVGSNARVFTSKERPSFWVNSQGCNTVKVSLYKKDLLEILGSPEQKNLGVEISSDLSIYKPYNSKKESKNIFASLAPYKTWTRNLHPDSQDWSYESFKTEAPLEPGDYFATVEASNFKGEKDWNVLWFSVTDIGLMVKQDADKTVVRAVNLLTLKAAENVQVELKIRGDKEAGNPKAAKANIGKTSKDGMLELAVGQNAIGNNSLIVYGSLKNQHAYGGMSVYSSSSTDRRTYFYTDRPIYRLGQTVYYRGISRQVINGVFKNAGASEDISVKIEDPDNQEILTEKVKTSKFGTFNGTFKIPQEGKTGAYQISMTYPDGSVSYENIEIDEYRKPEYKVEVTPLETRVIAGQKAKARIRASYYFGAPVVHAKVKYSIYASNDWYARYKLMSRPEYYSYFDDWDNNDDDYSYGGNYVTEGIAETDDAGEAIIEFETSKVDNSEESIFSDAYEDKKYKVEAEVTDISRLSVLSSGNVSVSPGQFVLFVDPQNYVCRVGETIKANFNACDYQGIALANLPVKLKLVRRIWDRNEGVYKGTETLEELTLKTNNLGKGVAEFKTQAQYVTDTYYLIASAQDSEKNQIYANNSIWIASENNPYILSDKDASKEPLTLKLDKTVYENGETIKAMISAPVTGAEGAQALVCVEGPKLYNYRLVDLKATATMIDIPIAKEYSPNVYITVCMLGKKRQFYLASEMVKISPQDHFLNISVNTDKAKYKPGETATYTLKALDDKGKPAENVELSLGLVDESIYAIRADYAQDIRKFFYRQRENMVRTLCSFPEEYSGGPNKIEPRVRKDFKDTAAWLPSLVTNKDGIVQAKIKLPDNLTTWRATVRGISLDTNVGSVIQKVVSTQDLIVRLALPRFFSQGDQGEISAIVHNYSNQKQNIKVSLSASQEFQINKSLVEQVSLEPEKVARISWPANIISSGTGIVKVKAIGQTAADAMETKLPLRPLGVPVVITRTGFISAEDQTVDIPLSYPKDASVGSIEAKLELAPSTLAPVLGNFSSLIDYPYGCTEQTMSKLMPAVVAVKMNQKLGVPLKESDKKRFQEVYKLAMAKLTDYQHEDGGWGWWKDDKSQAYLTALVLEGYKLLEETGYVVEQENKKKGLAWLANSCDQMHKQLSDPLLLNEWWHQGEVMTDLARATYVMSLHAAKPKEKLSKWLLTDKILKKLNPESLSYYALAFKNFKDENSSQVFLSRLLYLANLSTSDFGTLISFERGQEMFKKYNLDDKDSIYFQSYRYTDVETTALALRACIALNPSDMDRSESIKRWLMSQRSKEGWGNTKSTAEVFKALTDAELSQTSKNEMTNYSLVVLNTKLDPAQANMSFANSSLYDPAKTLQLTLLPNQKQIQIHKQGKGRLYWTSTLKYFKKLETNSSGYLANTPQALSVKREFVRLTTSYDATGKIHFKETLVTDSIFKAGETVMLKLSIDSPIEVPYTILEATLPSGAEVIKNDPHAELAESADGKNESEYDYFGSWWWTHQDIMDDHMAYFISNFPKGKHVIKTMVRLELPGKFQMNPATLEGMYTNNFRAYSQADQIEVR